MSTRNLHPKWWQLYLTLPLLVVLFMGDSRLKISSGGHEAAQIGIVLLVYGLIYLWLKANAKALRYMDEAPYRSRATMIRVPVSPPLGADSYQVFQLPESEIKGVLSDTFEMSYIDAEFSPVDNVSQEMNKE